MPRCGTVTGGAALEGREKGMRMRSGRHGAARPPVGVLIQQDRIDFALFVLIFVIALVSMVFSGPGSIVFWLGLLTIGASVVLAFRRMEQLSKTELGDSEFL